MAFRMRWPTSKAVIRQRFGENPAAYRKFGLPGHEGVDLVAPKGSAVIAAADGFVSDVRLDGFSDPMLKPYGNQVRIQHLGGYETVYAHLSEVAVVRGELVKAGQLIGLAGDTGHAGDPHLHLSLKRFGATLNGQTTYPYDLVDPEPFLRNGSGGITPSSYGDPAGSEGADIAGDESPSIEPSMQVVVDAAELGYLNLHTLPRADADILQSVPHGALLDALEDASAVRSKIGRQRQWLWVRTPDGTLGWAAAWLVKEPDGQAVPPEDLDSLVVVVVDSADEVVWLRKGPSVAFAKVLRLPQGTALRALEATDVVEDRVGQRGKWLRVLSPTGDVGYCGAWHLRLVPFGDKPVIPEPPIGEPTQYVVVDSPGAGLRLRAGPGTDYERVWWLPHRLVLTSLEDPEETGAKIGRAEEWIHVRTPAHYEGYAAAWYLRHPEAEDARLPVSTGDLPTGLSPHIFGIHAVSIADDAYTREGIRSLYEGSGKQGWIFFTEICGRRAGDIQRSPELRQRLWDWADAGYGVIIRLNYGYEPGGTLPESRYYDDFAAAAARWVEVYLRDTTRAARDYVWTIQIANEQNNPREHPGGFEHPTEHITAGLYADAFNRTYAAIKRVLPNSIVCPGAVDPYNYMPMYALGGQRWRPLDYFETMMAEIDVLDGIILHSYTHGPDLSRITDLKRFGDGTGPLWDHYYDFQAYRVFMERIPAHWRDLPVYITEMNHIHRPAGEWDQGWINRNVGWVRAVYEELDRWNRMPYAQQIRCGLLYRWIGDAWSLFDKKEILTDFREALAYDYRWRAEPEPQSFSMGAALSVPWKQRRGPRVRPLEERFLIQPDDLTVLRGVGKKTQVALRTAGIMIYEQLAESEPQALATLLAETGLPALHIESWPEQAALASAGKWQELAEYRQRLVAN